MTYEDWLQGQLDFYQQELAELEADRERLDEAMYRERCEAIQRNMAMLRELFGTPAEDSA